MSLELISREDGLAVIEAFVDRPKTGLSAIVLHGEAGIGKSILWLAAVGLARERSHVVLASRPAESERTLPNVVLGDLFGGPAEPRRPFPIRLWRSSTFTSGADPAIGADRRAIDNVNPM